MEAGHISDHDLERHYLGMITDEAELADFEEHLLCCTQCVDRSEETQEFVDAMRILGMRLKISDPHFITSCAPF
jgi:hypothetical protein